MKQLDTSRPFLAYVAKGIIYAEWRMMVGILRFMIKHDIMRKYAIYALLYNKEE